MKKISHRRRGFFPSAFLLSAKIPKNRKWGSKVYTVRFQDALQGFRQLGIREGDTVLIHSALRPFGFVEGGGAAVANALFEALGKEKGTLIAPAFCFKHEIEENPVIDPENDSSEMGIISEAVRHMDGAVRNAAYRHSFSAVGKNAHWLTDVDPYLSVFDMRSVFGKMLALDTKVVLAGVTYINSTTHHFGEYLLQVPDRHTIQRAVRLKKPDGSMENRFMTDYQPRPTLSGSYYEHEHDFNRLGLRLEQAGKVAFGTIGNAVLRMYSMRELISLILWSYPLDQTIFWQDGAMTELPLGKIVTREYVDGAGRPDEAVWSCIDPGKICRHKTT